MARIVVVEDVPMTRKVIELALRRMGHEVVGTCSPLAASAIVREQAPDVVILDYFMPCVDGASLLGRLRAEFGDRGPKALFISAAPYEVVMAGAERFTVQGYVSKPFRLRDLERAVVNALGTHHLQATNSACEC